MQNQGLFDLGGRSAFRLAKKAYQMRDQTTLKYHRFEVRWSERELKSTTVVTPAPTKLRAK